MRDTIMEVDDVLSVDGVIVVDFAALNRWLDHEGVDAGPIKEARLLGGGAQNIVVQFRRGVSKYVLRRPPAHPRPSSNASIIREATILSALDGTEVPHPRVVSTCNDKRVMAGVNFFVMEHASGFNPTVELPSIYARDNSIRHEMGLAASEVLGRLSHVNIDALNAAGIARPNGFLERQSQRWLTELLAYEQLDGYPGAHLPSRVEIAEWLDTHIPATTQPGLVHGDYHLGNLLYATTTPTVEAVLDWEMATVGDPLLDLAWLLATWPGRGPIRIPGAIYQAGGLATAEELIDRYVATSGRDVSELGWFEILAYFKLGVILEGTYARACAGKAPRQVGELFHRFAATLFESAGERLTV